MAVVAYYTDHIFKNHNIMIVLRRLSESYSEENMGILLIEVFKNFELIERLNYFVTDNANSNNLIIDYVLRIFLLLFTSLAHIYHRQRYFGYILNFVSDFYLYGKDPDSFEIKIIIQISLAREQKVLKI
jgi:hypothetical protein